MKPLSKFSPYLILLIGFALRLYRLGADSLWYDETVSVVLAQSDLAELVRHTAGDIHPPLYYILLHFWGRVMGWSEFAAAFLSLWFGVLLIALVYHVSREWFSSSPVFQTKNPPSGRTPSAGTWIAILAALFVAVSPYNIWYSQEVRMYTIGAILGLLSVYFLRRALTSPKPFGLALIAYVLVTVLGFYTLYYFIFFMLLEWAWVAYSLWQTAKKKSLLPPRPSLLILLSAFLVSQLALVVLYLPWLATALRQATDPPVPPWREYIALPRVILESFSALTFGQAVDPTLFGIIALLLVFPIAALFRREFISRRANLIPQIENQPSTFNLQPSTFFLLSYFLLPLAAIYLLSLWKPLYHVRYIFTYSPAFYILAAAALANLIIEFSRATIPTLWKRGLTALALLISLAFVAIAGYSLNNYWHSEQYAQDDLRGAVNYIADQWRPSDVVLVNAGYAYPALVYYYPETLIHERLTNFQPSDPSNLLLQTGSIDGAKILGWGDPRSDFYSTTADETRAALDRVFARHPRVWMLRIYDTVTDPNGIIRAYFDQHATLFQDHPFAGESQTRVQGFLTQPTQELPEAAQRIEQNLADRVQLVGYETISQDIPRGGNFDTIFYWKLLQPVNYNYQVTLQLLDANGTNVAQYDETPLSELLPMTRWQVPPPNTAELLYREPLRLKIPATLPPGTYRAIAKLYEPRSGDVLGDIIELGTLQIR